MNNLLLLLSFGLFLSIPALGQNAGRFVGTWVLDKEASFPKKAAPVPYKYYNLVISLEGTKLTIRKDFEIANGPRTYEMVLFLDGRGETNRVPFVGQLKSLIVSHTKIRKSTIIREIQPERQRPQNMSAVNNSTELYELLENGNSIVFSVNEAIDLDVREVGGTRALERLAVNRKLIFRKQ